MSFHELVRTRRTAHAWLPTTVPSEVLTRALEAAHHAPCHKLTWPWRFHVLGPQARATLTDLAVAAKQAGGTLPEAQVAAIRAKLDGPAEAIMLGRRQADDPMRAHEDYAAVAAATQNLMLSLHADGFATKWSTGAFTRSPGAYALLGIDRADEVIEGVVFVGRPATLPTIPRPPLDTVVRRLP